MDENRDIPGIIMKINKDPLSEEENQRISRGRGEPFKNSEVFLSLLMPIILPFKIHTPALEKNHVSIILVRTLQRNRSNS